MNRVCGFVGNVPNIVRKNSESKKVEKIKRSFFLEEYELIIQHYYYLNSSIIVNEG